jgi:hypothetical protein
MFSPALGTMSQATLSIWQTTNAQSVRPNARRHVESCWNVMAHGDGREGNWRWMEWVAGNLHSTSEHGVSSITTTDAHTSASSSRLNWRPCRFKSTRPFRRKTKYGSCACAVTFQTQSTLRNLVVTLLSKAQARKRLNTLCLRCITLEAQVKR